MEITEQGKNSNIFSFTYEATISLPFIVQVQTKFVSQRGMKNHII